MTRRKRAIDGSGIWPAIYPPPMTGRAPNQRRRTTADIGTFTGFHLRVEKDFLPGADELARRSTYLRLSLALATPAPGVETQLLEGAPCDVSPPGSLVTARRPSSAGSWPWS